MEDNAATNSQNGYENENPDQWVQYDTTVKMYMLWLLVHKLILEPGNVKQDPALPYLYEWYTSIKSGNLDYMQQVDNEIMQNPDIPLERKRHEFWKVMKDALKLGRVREAADFFARNANIQEPIQANVNTSQRKYTPKLIQAKVNTRQSKYTPK